MKKENISKKEGNYYSKVLFTMLVVALLWSIIAVTGYIGFQYIITKTRTEVNNYVNNPPFTCEIKFRELYYKGPCQEDVINGMGSIADYYAKLELLPLCMSSPYSYRYTLCNAMEGK